VGHGRPQQVGLDRGGQQRPRPLQHRGDDQGRGLVAAGGPEHQDRVALLGRQQPPQQAWGAAQDHPARLGLPHREQAQLAVARPDRTGMLGRPWVAGAVAGGSAGQVPQHRGRSARDATDQAGKRGVHAARTRQRAADVGRPGHGGVAPVVGQVPEDVGNVGGGDVEPGVAEGEAGELAGGPRQRAGAGGGAQAEGEELVAGAGERRRVRRPMPTRGQGRPGLMLHLNHPRARIGSPRRSRLLRGVRGQFVG
jgi:hypothetical protein